VNGEQRMLDAFVALVAKGFMLGEGEAVIQGLCDCLFYDGVA